MSKDNKIEEIIEYDMEALRAKADLLGIKYSNNIGGKKLKEKIDLVLVEADDEDDNSSPENVTSVGPSNKIKDIERAARKLETVIISDNDSSQAEDPTIVHKVQNAYFKIGCVIRKDVEQDVPHAIVEALKHKTMIKWVNSINTITKRPTGNKTPITKKRYNIQYV